MSSSASQEEHILISVIVPVYKVETFLCECVESILTQNYRHLELILVDDGSPDGSARICDNYAVQDPRVRVIHKANGGASDARNVGLAAACGEYIIFVDGDDYWGDEGALERVVNILLTEGRGVDLLYLDCTYVTPNGIKAKAPYDISRINGRRKVEALEYLIAEDRFIVTPWSKFIRRAVLTDNNITFKKGIRSEDYDWNFELLRHCRTLRAIDQNFYFYRVWGGSVTSNISTQHLFDIWGIIVDWYTKLPTKVSDPEERGLYMDFVAYIYGVLLSLIYRADGESRQRLIGLMRPYAHLMHRTRSGKMKKASMLYRLLGFSLTWRALGLFNRLRDRA